MSGSEPQLSSGTTGMEPGISLSRRTSSLIEQLRTGGEVERWEAVRDLRRLGQAAVPGLLSLLQGSNGEVRGYAAIALGRIGDRRALNALLEALVAPQPVVRRMAARALGRLRDPESTGGLVAALRDEEPGVRADSAEALGWIGSRDATPALITLLGEDPLVEVRQSAALALGRIGDGRCAASLLDSLQTESDTLRRALRFALRRIEGSEALPALEAARNHPDPVIRNAARGALARLRRRRW